MRKRTCFWCGGAIEPGELAGYDPLRNVHWHLAPHGCASVLVKEEKEEQG